MMPASLPMIKRDYNIQRGNLRCKVTIEKESKLLKIGVRLENNRTRMAKEVVF